MVRGMSVGGPDTTDLLRQAVDGDLTDRLRSDDPSAGDGTDDHDVNGRLLSGADGGVHVDHGGVDRGDGFGCVHEGHLDRTLFAVAHVGSFV